MGEILEVRRIGYSKNFWGKGSDRHCSSPICFIQCVQDQNQHSKNATTVAFKCIRRNRSLLLSKTSYWVPLHLLTLSKQTGENRSIIYSDVYMYRLSFLEVVLISDKVEFIFFILLFQ